MKITILLLLPLLSGCTLYNKTHLQVGDCFISKQYNVVTRLDKKEEHGAWFTQAKRSEYVNFSCGKVDLSKNYIDYETFDDMNLRPVDCSVFVEIEKHEQDEKGR